MKSTLELAFDAASPRISGGSTPWRSGLIHGAVLIVWIALFANSFRVGGILAWSVGLIYILYDTVLLAFTFLQTWNITRSQTSIAGAQAATSIGVIVAAHNEANVLPITLTALLDQRDPPDAVVVADDGSEDGTAALLEERYGLVAPAMGTLSAPSKTFPTLRWLRLPHGGKALALNAAIVLVEVDVVLTVDGDTLLEPDAISAVRTAFALEPELVAATGVLTPVCGPGLRGRVLQWFQTYEYIRNFLSRYAWMRQDGLLLISGAFAGFRRAAVIEVGGFDVDCLVEDYELIHRLRRFGSQHHRHWTTRVLGRALARTEAPSTVGAFLRQRRRWFGGFLQTQYWYRDMVGDARYGRLGTRMLPIKAIDALQPVYGLAALFALLGFVVSDRVSVLGPVAILITAKIALDLAFHCWSVHVYRRWIGDSHSANIGFALLAAVAEPFTFQILRHTGAVLGWVVFLTGRKHWGRQERIGRFGLPPITGEE